jgi:hypothetical protein
MKEKMKREEGRKKQINKDSRIQSIQIFIFLKLLFKNLNEQTKKAYTI